MARTEVRRDQPVPGTHLTELELQEIWYQHMEQLNPGWLGRSHKRLFPRSRKDLIQYYTQQDLERRNGMPVQGQELQEPRDSVYDAENATGA